MNPKKNESQHPDSGQQSDEDAFRRLMKACQRAEGSPKNLADIEAILKEHPRTAFLRDRSGQTALIYCASLGHLAALKILIPYSNVMDAQQSHETALMVAAERGRVDCVLELLDIGRPEHVSVLGHTALMAAAARGHAQCARILLPRSDALVKSQRQMNALMLAVCSGSVETVAVLLPASDLSENYDMKEVDPWGAPAGQEALAIEALIAGARLARHEKSVIESVVESSAPSTAPANARRSL